VAQLDGSTLRLRKLHGDYDPSDRLAAMAYLLQRQAAGEIATGLLYLDPDPEDLHDRLGTVETPLNQLPDAALAPEAAALEGIIASLR
jgi:2-oxoglutarate ferredoxin oxidoreductase subunit beta